MAEAQAQQEKKEGGGFHTIKNIFKGIGRSMGIPFHYTESDARRLPTYLNLDKEINFKVIAQLNETMRKAEATWDGMPSKDKGDRPEDKSAETKGSAGFIKDRIIDLYTDDPETEPDNIIKSSIGPFTDKLALNTEGNAADRGSSPLDTNRNPIFKTETLEISKYGTTITSNFSIPQEKLITYHDATGNRSYKVTFAGRRTSTYWDKLYLDVDEICRKVLEKSLQEETDATLRQNISDNLRFINKKIRALIGSFNEYQSKFEEAHRSSLIGGGGVVKHWNIIEKLKFDILKLKLTDEQVYYTHTYRVVKPVVPITEIVEREIIDDAGEPTGRFEKVAEYVYDDKGNIVYDYLKDHVPPDWKRAEEVEFGLDNNGYPLEVGDGATLFTNDRGNRRILEEGIVLIDLYENRTPRQVPKEFIDDVDLLDLAVWIYVSYDAYRDDLRDGRYHLDSISVMERIMTELRIPDFNHPQTSTDIRAGTHPEITMYLNDSPRGPNGPKSVKMPVKPSHLNPAFDTRAFQITPSGKTRHMGRKYYYDLQENNYGTLYGKASPDPTISTRGAALYILHRVIEETKYWSSEQAPPGNIGVIELLQAIGEITDGFDIGPNIGPGFIRWGQPLTRNPFKPI